MPLDKHFVPFSGKSFSVQQPQWLVKSNISRLFHQQDGCLNQKVSTWWLIAFNLLTLLKLTCTLWSPAHFCFNQPVSSSPFFRSVQQDDGVMLPVVHCWLCLSALSALCLRNLSGCPLFPSAAAETPAQTPAGSPPAAGQTEPTPPETETLRSEASCWLSAAGSSVRPSGPHGPCGTTLQPGEGQRGLSVKWRHDWVGGLRRREKADESWKRRLQ